MVIRRRARCGRAAISSEKGEGMFERLLFTADFSPFTEKLMGCVEELVNVGMRELILLHVIEAKKEAEYGNHFNPAYEARLEEAGEMLEKLESTLSKRGYVVKAVVSSGDPATRILETARDERASVIFLGAHGKGLVNRFLLGSVSEKVLKLADRPVMIQQSRIVGEGEGYSLENVCSSLLSKILIANDFSEYSEHIKPALADFTRTVCAPVVLLHVQEGRTGTGRDAAVRLGKQEAREEMQRLQEYFASLEEYCQSVETLVVGGDPATRILEIAGDINASMIVMGAFGQRGALGDLLGSVTEKVVRRSEVPVLVLKEQ